MPDLPTPQDATEAALFSECWDAVLSYADLCTAGSSAATQLATEAFALGMRDARADMGPARSLGRRGLRLPVIPLLLTAVRATAAAWEENGQGHELDPDLRLWLHSEKAARYTGPPLKRPLALRGLRDLQEADADLLWLAEVEALPLSLVARRLGLDPALVSDELAQVRGLFRDRCHRNHLDTPMDPHCRSYARLLDALTRAGAASGTPDDLSRHLSTCVQCAEVAACMRLHGGGLPAALSGGVIGWGGLAYLERRRRASEVRLGAGRPDPADAGPPNPGAQKARLVRNGLLVTAVLVSLLALGVSMMPMDDDVQDGAAAPGDSTADRQPVAADPSVSLPAATSSPATSPTPTPSDTRSDSTGKSNPDPEPQGTTSSAARDEESPTTSAPQAACTYEYTLVNQWPDGFQATFSVTTEKALSSWQVAWTFKDGQKVTQMWDATFAQSGTQVTATAADYNKTVTANGSLAFGFLASWQGANSPAYDVTLNGEECTKS